MKYLLPLFLWLFFAHPARAQVAWTAAKAIKGNNFTIAHNGDYLYCQPFHDSVWSPSDGMIYAHGTAIDLYIARYTAAGQLLWLHGFGGKQAEDYAQLIEDGKGGIYFLATAYDTTYLSGQGQVLYPMDTPSYVNSRPVYTHEGDIILAKYDANGHFKWLKQMGGAMGDIATGIFDAKDNLYMWGTFDYDEQGYVPNTKAAKFDTLVVRSGLCTSCTQTPFLARFDTGGHIKWLTYAASGNSDGATAWHIALDGKGGIYCDGSATNRLSIGSISVVNPSPYVAPSLFLMKFDTTGQPLWGKNAAWTTNIIPPAGQYVLTPWSSGFAVDTATGCTFISGNIHNTAYFGCSTPQKLSPDYSPFLAKFSATGAYLWAKNAGVLASGDTRAYGLALDQAGDAYATGYFTGTGTFNGQTASAQSFSDVMVCKYSGSTGTPVWMMQASTALGYNVWTDVAYNVFVSGGVDTNAHFGSVALNNPAGTPFMARISQPGLSVPSPFARAGERILRVYPNPASDAITIAWEGSGYERIMLTNTLGSKMSEFSVPQGGSQFHLSTSELPSGVYFIALTGRAGTLTAKISIRP